jgi:prepilin-type N-terminal cleavage/methylation domain-containing protein
MNSSLPTNRYQLKAHNAFTLVELIVSMLIFTVFVGVVTSTFIFTSRTLREANEVRKVYGEARFLVDRLTQEVRLNTIDYDCLNGGVSSIHGECPLFNPSGVTSVLPLISEDGQHRTVYRFENDLFEVIELDLNLSMSTWKLAAGYSGFEVFETQSVTLEEVEFVVAPTKSPYENFSNDKFQFHPSVNINVTARSTSSRFTESVPVQLQTTVSSRLYK